MRIKDIGNINARVLREDTPRDYTFQYIDIGGVSSDGQITLSEPMRYDESPSRARRIVKQNDVIVSTVRTYLRAIAGIDWDAKDTIASTGFAVITPDKKHSPAYIKYLMTSDAIVDEIQRESTGVSYPAINASRLSAIHIPDISLEEQKAVATYLDKQLSSINNRICLRERELQTLIKLKQSEINSVITQGLDASVPMKDSGIDWIGQIPAHWHTIRLKDVSYLYGGLTGKAGDDFRCDDLTQTKPFIPFTNILNNSVVDFSAFKQVVMADGEDQNRVRENDILFLMSSEDYESIGKTAIVLGDPGEVYLNSFCRGLRFTNLKDVYPKFVNYLLLADKYRDALRFEARGFTRINLKIDKISSLSIAIPPIDEQKAIVAYLDDKYAKIEAMTANINAQIEKLKVLKKALINEVISGKRTIDV